MASITSAQTGPWSATGTWTGGVVPVLGDKVTVQAAHTVTLDGTYSVGDDTATALTVAGTLKASRSVSSQLTARGQVVVTGTLDLGTEADPIPAGVAAKLIYNDSAAMAHAKWGVTASGSTSTVRVWGAPKTGRTAVTAVTSSTVFDVTDATGWLVGDWLCLGPTSPTLTTIDWRAIAGIAALSGTAARITIGAAPGTTTAVGRDVCNLTRNVQIVPAQVATWAAGFSVNPTTTAGQIEFGNCEIVGVGASTSVAAAITVAPTAKASVKAFKGVVLHDIAAISGSTVTSASLGSTTAGNLNLVILGQSVAVGSDVLACSRLGAGGVALGNGWSFSLLRPTVIGAYAAFPNAAFSGSAYGGTISDPYVRGVGRVFAANYIGSVAVVGGSVGGFDRVSSGTTVGIGLSITDCNLNGGALGQTSASDMVLAAASNGAIGIAMKGCQFASGAAVARSTNLGNASALTQIAVTNKNNDPTSQERYTNGGQMLRDNGTTRRGLSSVQMDCWYAGQPLTYSFTFKVAAGQTVLVKGAMRYSATYGAATPPTVTISGLGTTPAVATCPTTGAATWYEYSLTVTNPQSYPGEFTVTYTGQSSANSAGAYCWFDGVPDSPWVDSVRHFGYLWDSLAYRTADSRIALTESAALALAVAVNHTTRIVTVSGALTNAQVFQACLADLCQAANQGKAVHITSADGAVFTTTYTVAFTGSGAISGVYSDAVGMSTRLQITGLTAATVAVYNGSGTRVAVATSQTGVYTLDLPAGQTGTWSWKVAAYGLTPQTGTFTPNTGAVSVAPAHNVDVGVTQATTATVAAYTSLTSPDMFYDYLAYWETTTAGIDTARPATKIGSACSFGALSLVLNATAGVMVALASGVLTLKAGAVTAGATFSEFTATGASLSLLNGATVGATVYTDAAGRHVSITASAIVSGSRVQFYDVTNGVELSNSTLSGAGATLLATWAGDRVIRLRAEKDTKLPLQTLGVLTQSGLSFLDIQSDDTIYTANGIDGSTCDASNGGEFLADGTHIQIDINDSDGVTSVTRLYAWIQWYQTTAEGIASGFFGAMTAIDAVTYIIDQAIADIKLDNVSSTPVRIVGGYLARRDGSTVIAPNSGSIQMDPGKAYLANGSVPTAAANAAAVRTELSVELARVDAAVSSRLATSGYTSPDASTTGATVTRVEKLLRNKRITDPVAGTQTIYDNDGATVLVSGALYEDAAGTQPYRGQGAERAERLA